MTVVYGPNEAGKSTLLAFLRYVLFGFPSGRSPSEPLYKPQRGGTHGGRVVVEAGGRRLTIERFAGPGARTLVTRDDGQVVSDVGALLGLSDRAVFQKVFAFGLDELQGFAKLDHDAIREHLSMAGIVGGGRSPQATMKELRDRRTALLAPSKESRLSSIQQALLLQEAALAEARQAATNYPTLRAQALAAGAEVARTAAAIGAAQERRRDLEALLECWQAYYDGQVAARQLAALPPVDAVPESAAERLATAKAALAAAEQAVRDRASEVADTEQALASLPDDPAALARAPLVSDLRAARARAADAREKAVAARARADVQAQAIAGTCAALGADWDQARLVAFDRSIARREAVRAQEQALSQARAAAVAAARDRVAAQEARREQARRVDAAEARGGSTGSAPSPAHLKERGRALDDLAELVQRQAAQREGLEDDERRLREARAEASQATGGSDGVWLKPALVVLALACGLGGVLAGGLAAAAGITLGALLLVVALLAPGPRSAGAQAGEARVKSAEDALTDRQRRLKALADEIEISAAPLGLGAAPTIAVVDRARQDLVRSEAAAVQEAERARGLEELRVELARSQARVDELAAQSDQAAVQVAQADGAWVAWLAAAGLPVALTPAGALEALHEIERGQEAVRAIEAARDEARRNEEVVVAFEAEAGALLAGLGEATPAEPETLARALEAALVRCEAARDASQRREHLAGQLAQQVAARERAAADHARAVSTLGALLAEAEAGDEAEFAARLAIFHAREKLRATCEATDRSVALRLGASARAAGLRSELAAADPDRWRQEHADLQAQLGELEAARERAVEARRDAENDRKELEAASDVSRIEAEVEALRTELAEGVRQWRVLAYAEALIDQTLRRLERDSQPAVIQHAGRLFAEVTAGTYPHLRRLERGIVVVDRAEGVRDAAVLSRGTCEQLYLCMRLGLCQQFASQGIALPLVMDDVLVNFDAERAESVARMLLAFARDHQVLLFTCQPHTRDMLRALDPTIAVVTLPRYAGSATPAPVPLAAQDMSRVVAATTGARVTSGPLSTAADSLFAALLASPTPLRKSPLLEASGVSEEEWQAAIHELLERGLVDGDGAGKGKAYHVITSPATEEVPLG